MPVHCQRVLRADVPDVNRVKGTSSSKKATQDHEVVRKIGKRANKKYTISAIFTMRLENLCERGAWIPQIEIMCAFFRCQLEPVALWHSVLWQETPKFWTQQRFHSRKFFMSSCRERGPTYLMPYDKAVQSKLPGKCTWSRLWVFGFYLNLFQRIWIRLVISDEISNKI